MSEILYVSIAFTLVSFYNPVNDGRRWSLIWTHLRFAGKFSAYHVWSNSAIRSLRIYVADTLCVPKYTWKFKEAQSVQQASESVISKQTNLRVDNPPLTGVISFSAYSTSGKAFSIHTMMKVWVYNARRRRLILIIVTNVVAQFQH